MSQPNETHVYELVGRYEMARESGTPPPLENLCASAPELLDRVREIIERLYPASSTTVPARVPPPDTARYSFRAFIARGGMGEVWCGYDQELQREVAIKIVRHMLAGAPPRFQAEARRVAQMQHPGIVPVHDLGTLPDGRPFFVMRLINGRNLEEILLERTDLPSSLSQFVPIFEQICQAVAYAHARPEPILHRDLKPSNIMLGAFGEVQVMDWGIARELGQTTPEVPTPNAPDLETESRPGTQTPRARTQHPRTRTGVMLGTAAYAAPEQVRGELACIGTQVDVFGLGSILCVILTGQPPYCGDDAAQVQDRARRADLADAWKRLDACGADVELINLTKACLDPMPSARPTSAREVAQRLAEHRMQVEQRLRRAELEVALGEERARQQLTASRLKTEAQAQRARLFLGAALVSSALLLLALVLGGEAYTRYCAEQEAVARREVALKAEQKAREREAVAQGVAEVFKRVQQEMVDLVDTKLSRNPGLQPFAVALYDKLLGALETDLSSRPDDKLLRELVVENFIARAWNAHNLGDTAEALKEYRRAETHLADIVKEQAPLRVRLRHTFVINNIGWVHSSRGEKQDALREYNRARELREALYQENGDDLECLRQVSVSYSNLGGLYLTLGQPERSLELLLKALPLKEELIKRQPDVFWHYLNLSSTLNELSGTYLDLKQHGKAKESRERAYVIRKETLARREARQESKEEIALTVFEQKFAAICFELADLVLNVNGDTKRSHELCEEGMPRIKSLVERSPANATYRQWLGYGLRIKAAGLAKEGKVCDARPHIEEAIQALEMFKGRLLVEGTQELTRCRLHLARWQVEMGERRGAARTLVKALQELQSLPATSARDLNLEALAEVGKLGSQAREHIPELEHLGKSWSDTVLLTALHTTLAQLNAPVP